jgi:hypothetical protein
MSNHVDMGLHRQHELATILHKMVSCFTLSEFSPIAENQR